MLTEDGSEPSTGTRVWPPRADFSESTSSESECPHFWIMIVCPESDSFSGSGPAAGLTHSVHGCFLDRTVPRGADHWHPSWYNTGMLAGRAGSVLVPNIRKRVVPSLPHKSGVHFTQLSGTSQVVDPCFPGICPSHFWVLLLGCRECS